MGMSLCETELTIRGEIDGLASRDSDGLIDG